MPGMQKERLLAVGALIIGGLLGWWIYSTEINATRLFKLGLDLSGGTHLVYSADTSRVTPTDLKD